MHSNEQKVVKAFVDMLNKGTGQKFTILNKPDELNRQSVACDAIVGDGQKSLVVLLPITWKIKEKMTS